LTKLTDDAVWILKNCKGSPGTRYGHVMSYLKPFIIVYGGSNSGNQTIGDLWKIDVEGNCVWEKIETGH